jgi:hypothetical protein
MKLTGIEIYESNGKYFHRSIIDGKVVQVRSDGKINSGFKKYLSIHGHDKNSYIMLLNNLSYDKLPLCKNCNVNKILFINKFNQKGVNLIDPRVIDFCSVKCARSYSGKKSYNTQINNGTYNNPSLNLSKEQLSDRSKKSVTTQLKKGNHIFLDKDLAKIRSIERCSNGKNFYGSNIIHDNSRFKSKAEVMFYELMKVHDLLQFYDREISIYSSRGTCLYTPDYSLKLEYNHLNIPKFIEVKYDNLFKSIFKNRNSDFSKFSYALTLGNILIFDKVRSNPFYLLNTKNDLLELSSTTIETNQLWLGVEYLEVLAREVHRIL